MREAGEKGREKKETCVAAPELTWDSHNDTHCEIHWPKELASHIVI